MKKNTDEKSLIKINENSIFYKIKQFFQNLFHNNRVMSSNVIEESQNIICSDKNKKDSFMEVIKNIEDEETKILALQKKYRNGEIKEEDLTEEQINSLCDLYDKQIANLKKSNDFRKQKLLEYRRNIQAK